MHEVVEGKHIGVAIEGLNREAAQGVRFNQPPASCGTDLLDTGGLIGLRRWRSIAEIRVGVRRSP